MINTIYQLIRTARPRQWLKNLSLFAPAMFAGRLFEPEIFGEALRGFFVFCVLSSGVYFVNDIVDAPKDRLHPIKKNRPIASGKLSEPLAWVVGFAFILGAILFSAMFVGTYFTLALIAYVLIQFSYSIYFRNVIILDSLIVASGFVIRVLAGGLASNTSISAWLGLTTIGIAMLMAFGKRRSEKTILAKNAINSQVAQTRATLRHYPDSLLDSIITMSATYTLITYSLFSFQVSPPIYSRRFSGLLPSIFRSPKWMMATIPLVIYGVARYLYVIYEKGEAESPERVLLKDKPLLVSVILWAAATLIIYYLPGLV